MRVQLKVTAASLRSLRFLVYLSPSERAPLCSLMGAFRCSDYPLASTAPSEYPEFRSDRWIALAPSTTRAKNEIRDASVVNGEAFVPWNEARLVERRKVERRSRIEVKYIWRGSSSSRPRRGKSVRQTAEVCAHREIAREDSIAEKYAHACGDSFSSTERLGLAMGTTPTGPRHTHGFHTIGTTTTSGLSIHGIARS